MEVQETLKIILQGLFPKYSILRLSSLSSYLETPNSLHSSKWKYHLKFNL